MLKEHTYKILVVFTAELLGSVSLDKETYSKYQGAKATEEQLKRELDALPEQDEKIGPDYTGFLTVDGGPALSRHVIKGYMKAACGNVRTDKESASSGLTAYKRRIDQSIRVEPELIPLELPEGGQMDIRGRSIRASTAQGERIALTWSESCPIGTQMQFYLTVLGSHITEEMLVEWFFLGLKYNGFGQWRGSGDYGRFKFAITDMGEVAVMPSITVD